MSSDLSYGLCRRADYAALRDFVASHWGEDHALAKSRELFEWMYGNGGRYQVVAARQRGRGGIEGMLAYQTPAQYDAAIGVRDVSLQMWRAAPRWRGRGVGTALFETLRRLVPARSYAGVGMSAEGKRAFRRLGFRVGRVQHHYLRAGAAEGDGLVEPIAARDLLRRVGRLVLAPALPAKSIRYAIARYGGDPARRYEFHLVGRRALAVTRAESGPGTTAVHLVDYLGPPSALAGTAPGWRRLVAAAGAAYVSFLSAGYPAGWLRAAGFTRRRPGDGAVVPIDFEPFTGRNTDVEYAVLSPARVPFTFVKGDSDRDRPRRLA